MHVMNINKMTYRIWNPCCTIDNRDVSYLWLYSTNIRRAAPALERGGARYFITVTITHASETPEHAKQVRDRWGRSAAAVTNTTGKQVMHYSPE